VAGVVKLVDAGLCVAQGDAQPDRASPASTAAMIDKDLGMASPCRKAATVGRTKTDRFTLETRGLDRNGNTGPMQAETVADWETWADL